MNSLRDRNDQRTLIPSGEEYSDQRIVPVMQNIQVVKDEIMALSNVEYTNEIMWEIVGKTNRLKKLEEKLKILLNDEKSRKLLAAEMTQLFERLVDKKKGSGYGDDFEEHF